MRVAVIGSRELEIQDMEKYIPKLIFLPDYNKYGKSAPLIRNKLIVEHADIVIAIWDGVSRGTKYTTDYAKSIGKEVKVYTVY